MINDHWRGRETLAFAFWINNVLVSALLTGLSYGVFMLANPAMGRSRGTDILIGSLAFAYIAFLCVVGIWQWVGLWRSATNSSRIHSTVYWPLMAKLWIIVSIVFFIKEPALLILRLLGFSAWPQ